MLQSLPRPPLPTPTAETPAELRARESGQVVLVVRDLIVTTLIGIYDYEYHVPQRLRVNMEVALAATAGQPWTHGALVDAASSLVTAGHTNLLESLAERLAATALSDGRARSALVRLEKLDAFAECAAVGVEITRIA